MDNNLPPQGISDNNLNQETSTNNVDQGMSTDSVDKETSTNNMDQGISTDNVDQETTSTNNVLQGISNNVDQETSTNNVPQELSNNNVDQETSFTQPLTIPQTTASMETLTNPTSTTMPSESSSTLSNNEQASSTGSRPSEWLGYYDYGVHKPEFIRNIEFTTNYPSQVVREDIRYVTYEAPFKPSLPDYSNDYTANFYVPFIYKHQR